MIWLRSTRPVAAVAATAAAVVGHYTVDEEET